jgi:hypothetical protein
MITNFEICNNIVTPLFHNVCIFCLEDINKKQNKSVSDEVSALKTPLNRFDFAKNEVIQCNTNGIIILGCNHNYHSECFIQYIIHKLHNKRDMYFLNCNEMKCPICMRKLYYTTISKLLESYKQLLENDIGVLKKKIYKFSYIKKRIKFVFFMRKVINKENYIGEIYNYYKIKNTFENLKNLKNDIANKVQILNSIRLYNF